jgi:hypothetical protein
MNRTEYVVIVQCDIIKERCPGYLCEKNFHNRTGGFAALPAGKSLRMMNMTCSGCCGRALHRKLSLLLKRLARQEDLARDQVLNPPPPGPPRRPTPSDRRDQIFKSSRRRQRGDGLTDMVRQGVPACHDGV